MCLVQLLNVPSLEIRGEVIVVERKKSVVLLNILELMGGAVGEGYLCLDGVGG